MKLSLVFELLLIFILLAFAASKSVKKNKISSKKHIQNRDSNGGDKSEENNINKYCKCAEAYCNCCKDFQLSAVALNGPGCASLKYLNGDKMSISLSFGKKVITNRTMSSRKPSPVCMPLPGGISKFCGRVYNIARAGEEFRACLGLELQSKKTVEAAVRVSCFKFGPRGVTSEPADPLPLVPKDEKNDEEEDDDDDYDDDAFGLVGDEDDDDEDDDDDDGEFDAANVVDTSDYASFSLLGEDLLGDIFGSTGDKKKPKKNLKKQAPLTAKTTTTSTTTTTTRRPRPSRRPTRRPGTRTTTVRSTRSTTQRSTRSTTPRRTRTTTPRTTRSTTARNTRSTTPRPTRATSLKPSKPPRTKRPTRRPTRRPTKTPTTESTSNSELTTTTNTTLNPTHSLLEQSSFSQGPVQVSAAIETTEHMQTINTISAHTSAPITVNTENTIVSVIPVNTTPKTVTNFEDSGIEMSLATITGQLSAMQVTPMNSNEDKDSNLINTEEEDPKYEKVETITTKTPSTVHVSAFLHDFETTEKEPTYGDETRGHQYLISDGYFDNLNLPKKPREKQFNLDDLDVLDLGKIGENLGDELGIFGKNKKHKNKHKEHIDNKHNDDYDDLVDAIGHTLMMRKSDKNIRKSDRRRQNKMMRGDWAIQPMVE